jgi:cell division protein FtsI/penicillin-binding protein 2
MIAGALLVAVGGAGLVACSGGSGSSNDAAKAGQRFLAAWASGDAVAAGALTDAPQQAAPYLAQIDRTLEVGSATITPGATTPAGNGVVALAFQVTLNLTGLGAWSYPSRLTVARSGGSWLVHWDPALVHSGLTPTTTLLRDRTLPLRAPILDRNGNPLFTVLPIYDIGIWPAKLSNPNAAYQALARLSVDPKHLAARVKAAPPNDFVEAITLRAADFRPVAATISAIPGIVVHQSSRSLASTPSFALAVLGDVGPATAQALASAGPLAESTDDVGLSGLQLAYQRQLAGTPGGTISIVPANAAGAPQVPPPAQGAAVPRGASGTVIKTFTAKAGTPLRTTLDAGIQAAAEQALTQAPTGSDGQQQSAIVVIQPSTGAILAAANGPASADGYNLAFLGEYPAGSTFKIVTTTALLKAGVTTGQSAPCPRFATVDGYQFKNDDMEQFGDISLAQDFAQSCNTGFVGLWRKLDPNSLPQAAALYGIGGNWSVGVPAFTGSVPTAAGDTELASDMIGQGRVAVSPLVMASVAATVAAGAYHQPYLLPADAGRYKPPVGVPPATIDQLRTLMRLVVTDGTASSLRDLPGDVAAKTGTAEFGSGSPPPTHGWMVGYRGDLAFAAIVETADSGNGSAGPIVHDLLSSVPR